MKVESQVCSVELAKKLLSLGVKQESYFHWKYDESYYLVAHNSRYFGGNGMVASAFSVAELGEMLPWAIESDGTDYVLMIRATVDGSWSIAYICIQKLKRFNEIEFEDMNEADCRAKMLVYLLEINS